MQSSSYQDLAEPRICIGFKALRNVSSCLLTKPKEKHDLLAFTSHDGDCFIGTFLPFCLRCQQVAM